MYLRVLVALLVGLAVVGVALSELSQHILSRAVVVPAETTSPALAPSAPSSDAAPAPVETRVESIELRRGDTLVRALVRAGVESRAANEIAAALGRSGADLRRLKAGSALELQWNASDDLMAVTWNESPWRGYATVASDDEWVVKRFETTPDVRVAAVQGQVTSSLWQAVEATGESPPLVPALVTIFESDFDFTADTRAGDRFRLLVEKRYAGETFISYGRILAAQYKSGRRALTGIGFAHGATKFAYYDGAGRSLKKSFLKSPLQFTRITSGFTYARPHPILGGVRPHLAIDYAAPTGTPVRAVADGSVTHAGWDGGNGVSVRLRHRSGYETMYNHLSKLAPGIRVGAHVSQRQVIGAVGATGLATGPHLDYRIKHNGSFVNPLNEKFLPGDPIPGSERPAFLEHARTLTSRLEQEAAF